ncbi:hypothetical protein ACFQ1E_08950 [Sphingomonas canadensis]|uniref:Uncharacterized protein n=1 Tax=Sphingomonas canadensis TaxID=1219257 RepID=A0ABW3HAI7_9SPHN|nr:hypothetical protein [Sphingomonas canadensis]MCW3836167.1 hypothetical protein [Sphingomonas canadensis]
MDLNYLLSRHQRALMMADAADCGEARLAHRGLAECYAARIRDLQQQLGAPAMLAGLA